jgi:hypothetical protein
MTLRPAQERLAQQFWNARNRLYHRLTPAERQMWTGRARDAGVALFQNLLADLQSSMDVERIDRVLLDERVPPGARLQLAVHLLVTEDGVQMTPRLLEALVAIGTARGHDGRNHQEHVIDVLVAACGWRLSRADPYVEQILTGADPGLRQYYENPLRRRRWQGAM